MRSLTHRQSFPALGPSSANDYWSTEDETAHAAFGQVTGRVNERWSVTGGLRVSHETAHTTYQGASPANASVSAAEEDSWDDSAWLAGFEYLPTASAVFFANVSTGFTSGGFTRTALPTGELDPYGPENLTAYEGGVRLRPPGRPWILGATAFRYDFDDMQVPSTIILANRPVTVVDNAAAARIYGTDMSSEVRIAERFTFSGALVWMPEREFVEFTGALAAGTLSGNTVSRAPEWSAEHVARLFAPTKARRPIFPCASRMTTAPSSSSRRRTTRSPPRTHSGCGVCPRAWTPPCMDGTRSRRRATCWIRTTSITCSCNRVRAIPRITRSGSGRSFE